MVKGMVALGSVVVGNMFSKWIMDRNEVLENKGVYEDQTITSETEAQMNWVIHKIYEFRGGLNNFINTCFPSINEMNLTDIEYDNLANRWGRGYGATPWYLSTRVVDALRTSKIN